MLRGKSLRNRTTSRGNPARSRYAPLFQRIFSLLFLWHWLSECRQVSLCLALPAKYFEILHRVEMLIERGNRGPVLLCMGRDPNVIVRNRRSLLAQFTFDDPVLPSRLDR